MQRATGRAAPPAYADDHNIGMQAMFALRQVTTRREFIELVGGRAQRACGDAGPGRQVARLGSGDALGRFGYQAPGGSPAMTAEGLLCRQFLGARRNDPAMRAGAEYLLKNLPQQGRETSYYWYYAAQVMYHMQGQYWTVWNDHQRDLLVMTQVTVPPPAPGIRKMAGNNPAGAFTPLRFACSCTRFITGTCCCTSRPLYQQMEE